MNHNLSERSTEKNNWRNHKFVPLWPSNFQSFSLGKIKLSNGGSGQMHQNHTTVWLCSAHEPDWVHREGSTGKGPQGRGGGA